MPRRQSSHDHIQWTTITRMCHSEILLWTSHRGFIRGPHMALDTSRLFMLYLLLTTLVSGAFARAPAGPWDAFNYAPASRNVSPATIRSSTGNVSGIPSDLVYTSETALTFSGVNSSVVFDFAKEIGGVLSFSVTDAAENAAIGLTFTESAEFISPDFSDNSCTSNSVRVEARQIHAAPVPSGTVTQTIGQQRGGFRYLTVVSNTDATVTVSDIAVALTFMPQFEDDLRAYTGYFSTSDPIFEDQDFLTKLWYAGAYTVQTNTIDVNEARSGDCSGGWSNDANGGISSGTVLVDGAKRDRNVWPGDMGISSHTELVSTNDLISSKNSLLVMFSTQDPATGALAYSGPPINAHGSDTYISWSLIGAHDYYLYTGDLEFIQNVWENYTFALSFLQSQVDSTGLMNVPQSFSNDWGRDGGAGHNSAANALLYRNLVTSAALAEALDNSALAAEYAANATAVKAAYNELLWDGPAGMFRDNETTALHPQDGNSLAVMYNVTANQSQDVAISEGLTAFWTPIGSLSPELNDTIIPFVGGFELRAHFVADQGERALDLMRSQWGYMLTTNLSVQSTLLEGFTANGSLGYRANVGYHNDFSYTSHAHGWSTGPTPALTFHVVGLTLTSPQGATWAIAPIPSGLDSAEGGFETGLGWFGVKWNVTASGSSRW
ncbi:glycoside hydrolase family 78 protein [Hymenopellis radicata]|nr:glycoside hydrolase family 78 protein [Hymenopellis radicata]